jgi:FkbM family methyltransferase
MTIISRLNTRINDCFQVVFSFLFTRKFFFPLHQFFFKYSLLGMGVNQSIVFSRNGEKKVLKKILRELSAPIVFDVGANIGEYSKELKKISNKIIIYAFEPHPKTFLILKDEATKHDFVAINKGLGCKEEVVKLFDYKNNDGSPRASLFKDVIEFQYSSPSVSHEVKISTVDDFVKENKIRRIHLLKIDTEGNELNVLIGAKNSLELNIIDIIQFEFNYTNIISKAFFCDFNRLLPRFIFYRIVKDGLIKLPPLSVFNEIFMYQNIIAINSNRITCR